MIKAEQAETGEGNAPAPEAGQSQIATDHLYEGGQPWRAVKSKAPYAEALAKERDKLQAQLNKVTAERDALKEILKHEAISRNKLLIERDALKRKLDAIQYDPAGECGRLANELNLMRESRNKLLELREQDSRRFVNVTNDRDEARSIIESHDARIVDLLTKVDALKRSNKALLAAAKRASTQRE